MMEDEIIKALEDITNLRIFPNINKFIVINFEYGISTALGLTMSKEEFVKFREWLKSKGFTEVEIDSRDISLPLLKHFGYIVSVDNSRRGLYYFHSDGKRAVFVTYAEGEVVVMYRVIYFEKV